MNTTTDRPSRYQIDVLRSHGCRVRPRDYASAKRRIDTLPPSDGQAALLRELGLPVPETRSAASAAITAYEEAHPEWTRARRAARAAKGRATLQERRAAGQEPQYNDTLRAWHQAGVERFGELAASLDVLAYLRALALRLPRDGEERLATFNAMRAGLSAEDAGARIDHLKTRVQG
ncbi:MAG TPA: hypothetical protein VF541_06795 [Longimicrobium sp.]|jgi:acyl-CoA reductase-like NAD-dependent aldehyde dehydrogenase